MCTNGLLLVSRERHGVSWTSVAMHLWPPSTAACTRSVVYRFPMDVFNFTFGIKGENVLMFPEHYIRMAPSSSNMTTHQAQGKVHKDRASLVWKNLTSLHRLLTSLSYRLRWVRVDTVSQAFTSSISVWPHRNSHKHTTKPSGVPSQKLWSCYSWMYGPTSY